MNQATKHTFFLVSCWVLVLGVVVGPILLLNKRARNLHECVHNLRMFDGAKQQWTIEFRKPAGSEPTWKEIATLFPRIPDDGIPCPNGGVYTIGPIPDPPTCSILEHQQAFMEIYTPYEALTGNRPPKQ